MTVQPLGGAVAKSLFLWPVTHRERFQSEGAFASVVELLRNNGGKRSLSLATARLLGKEVPAEEEKRTGLRKCEFKNLKRDEVRKPMPGK